MKLHKNNHISIFPLLLLSTFLFSLAFGHGGPMKNSFKSTVFNASWTSYEVDEKLYVNFTITAKTSGWLALGFNTPGGKPEGADYIVGYKNGQVQDCYQTAANFGSITTDASLPEGHNNIIDSSTSYANDILEVNVMRLQNTGDKYDYNLEQPKLLLTWAVGEGDSIKEEADFGDAEISFLNIVAMDNEVHLLKAHGIMMVLVVMVLMTSGMVLSRYLKLIFPWWFYAHTAILSLSVFFMIVSAIVVFAAHENKFKPGWHSVFGLFFIIGMSLQTLIGLLAHFKFDKKRLHPPTFPDKVHWYLGRGLFFLGMLTVIIGLYALPARPAAKNAFWVWVVIIFFLVLALEKHIGQTHEMPVKGIAEDDEAFMDDDEDTYTPKKGNSLSRGVVPREISTKFLFKLLCPAGVAIMLSWIFVVIGIDSTDM